MSAPVIQAQYDDLEKIAERFAQQADLIEQMRQQVRQATDALKNGGWQGQGSDAFQAKMDGEIFPAVNRLSQALQEGNQSTHQIIEVIKAAEEEAANPFRGNGQGGISGGTPVPSVTPSPSGSSSGGSSPGIIDFAKGVFDFGGNVTNVVSGVKTLNDFYKVYDQFDGLKDFLTQRTSMVTGFKDMFRTTAGKLGLGFSVIGAGFEIQADLSAGQSVAEVVVSEGTEFALETGIRLAAYSNPVSAAALTVWDGAVLAGDVFGVDVPSLGDATDAVGNLVYDAGEAVADFGGGLVDDAGDAFSSLKFW